MTAKDIEELSEKETDRILAWLVRKSTGLKFEEYKLKTGEYCIELIFKNALGEDILCYLYWQTYMFDIDNLWSHLDKLTSKDVLMVLVSNQPVNIHIYNTANLFPPLMLHIPVNVALLETELEEANL